MTQGEFEAVLYAAMARAGSYNDEQRAIITKAIEKANRKLAYD